MKKPFRQITLLPILAALLLGCYEDPYSGAVLYTIFFDLNGGTGLVPPPIEGLIGDARVTLPRGDFISRDGFAFVGWSEDPSGSDWVYVGGSFYRKPGGRDITLYAIWIDLPDFSVTFETGQGSNIPGQIVYAGDTVSPPLTNPVLGGYTFGGWFQDYDYKIPYDFSKPVYANTTIYARWDIGVPTGVTAVADSSTRIIIGWSGVDVLIMYHVYRGFSASGPFTPVGASSSNSYINSGLSPGTTYYYRVSAMDTFYGTESAQSDTVSATTAP